MDELSAMLMLLLSVYVAPALLLAYCVLTCYFLFKRQPRQRDAKGKWILALTVCLFYLILTICFYLYNNHWRQLYSAQPSGGYSGTSLSISQLPLLFYLVLTLPIILVPTMWVLIAKRKKHLLKNLFVYVWIGVFAGFICMNTYENYELIMGDKYIIEYVKKADDTFSLDRAKQLTHDPNLKTSDGASLLVLALKYEKYDYADYLVSQGADVNFYDTWGDWILKQPYYLSNEMKQYIKSRGFPGFNFTPRRLSLEEAKARTGTPLTFIRDITPENLWEEAGAQLFVAERAGEELLYFVADNGYTQSPIEIAPSQLISICVQTAPAECTMVYYLAKTDFGYVASNALQFYRNAEVYLDTDEVPHPDEVTLSRGEDGMVYLCSGEKRLILEP